MADNHTRRWAAALGLALAACGLSAGCLGHRPDPQVCCCPVPREKDMVTMPSYVIEPPDILLIDAIRVTPKPPYRIEPQDVLVIRGEDVLPDQPIAGLYAVDPDGTVNLGLDYGSVRVVGLTIPEARDAIVRQLTDVVGLRNPRVSVGLGQSRAAQQIRGEHLVRPDGTISLGLYGAVRVVGLTLPEAKAAIETHLTQYLQRPEVAVDVFAYNSKVFYVIYDNGGAGQQVVRLPITGNETVLDAVASLNGLNPVASQHHIWVARPNPACSECDQIMPVDWKGITRDGRTETNFQLMAGDRVYVQAQALVTLDNWLAKIISPMERLFGITLLGNSTVISLRDPSTNSLNGSNTTNNALIVR
jgi:polysaccharide export outer membrane protein